MKITDTVALVTGANRGLGRAIAQALVERGARTVYAAARRPETVDLPGVRPVGLDITDPDAVRAAVVAAPDVSLLVNNAGITTGTSLVTGDLDVVRRELETNALGHLAMIRAFAPALARAGGGAVVNVLSAMSWFPTAQGSAYHVSKAAAWAMTNGVRLELAAQGTLVTGVHLGLADTDMSAGWDVPKLSPEALAAAVLDGVEADATEVLADAWSEDMKRRLLLDPARRDDEVASALASLG